MNINKEYIYGIIFFIFCIRFIYFVVPTLSLHIGHL